MDIELNDVLEIIADEAKEKALLILKLKSLERENLSLKENGKGEE